MKHNFIYFRGLPRQSLWVLTTILFLSGCFTHPESSSDENKNDSFQKTRQSNQELKKVTFLPYWVATAQFAGYFVGKEMGIYEKYGIDLEILPYQPFMNSTDLMESGEADFAALWLANAIEMCAKGLKIVNIAQPSTQSSLMLITKKSSGISSLEQMNGKKAGIWSGYDLQPRALFHQYQIDVDIIPIGNTNNLFLKGGVPITIANWFDEYHSILNAGLDPDELNIFFFKDYGLNFLEDGIYCLKKLRDEDPELCQAFLDATFESWEYAFSHPDTAIDIVIQYAREAKIPVNKIHQQWMLARYQDLYMPKGKESINTVLRESDYESVGNILKDQGLILEFPSFDDFFQPVNMQNRIDL